MSCIWDTVQTECEYMISASHFIDSTAIGKHTIASYFLSILLVIKFATVSSNLVKYSKDEMTVYQFLL